MDEGYLGDQQTGPAEIRPSRVSCSCPTEQTAVDYSCHHHSKCVAFFNVSMFAFVACVQQLHQYSENQAAKSPAQPSQLGHDAATVSQTGRLSIEECCGIQVCETKCSPALCCQVAACRQAICGGVKHLYGLHAINLSGAAAAAGMAHQPKSSRSFLLTRVSSGSSKATNDRHVHTERSQ